MAILILCLACPVVAAPAKTGKGERPGRADKAPQADKSAAPSRDAPLGSIARQLDLKLRTTRASEDESLAQSIQHNRQQWAGLSPEQRDQYRRKGLAFLQARPEEQDRLLEHYGKLTKLPAEKRKEYRDRAQWLKVVVGSFTPQERQELQTAAPKERAGKLLQRKEEMIRQGKLTAVRPADAPTTQPPQK